MLHPDKGVRHRRWCQFPPDRAASQRRTCAFVEDQEIRLAIARGRDTHRRNVLKLRVVQAPLAEVIPRRSSKEGRDVRRSDRQSIHRQGVLRRDSRLIGSRWFPCNSGIDFRQRPATRLRTAGVSLETRKALLGHKTGDITSHYSAPELSELIRAANAVLKAQESTLLRV